MPNWYDVTRDPEYQSLPEVDRLDVKQTFFNETIGKDPEFAALDDVTKRATWTEFMQSPDDTGEGFVRSTLGSAARGFGEIVPGTIEGVGALTGIDFMREAGKSVREGLEYIAPVNPIYEQGIPSKLMNVAGNIGNVILTGGIGGATSKALAAERIAAATGQAARQALTNQAIQTGAKTALYGTGAAQGAAEGANAAEQYGMTGPEAYLRTLAGSASELLPEILPFGTALETALPRRLLGGVDDLGKVVPGIRMGAAQEGLEEMATQGMGNVATQALAPTGVETPDLTEGMLEAGALGAFGGALLGGIAKIGRPTPPEAQTPIQQSLAAEVNAIPVDEVPPQTEEEKRAGMEAGNPIIVDPQGNTAAVAPEAWNESLKGAITPRSSFVGSETPSDVESRLTDWMQNPGLAAAVQTADSIVTNAVDTSPDVSKAAEAALNVIQGVVDSTPTLEETAPPKVDILEEEAPVELPAGPIVQESLTIEPLVETPISDSPSPNLPPMAESSVEPMPARNGRDTSARDAWNEKYGDMRRGGRTHNNDGSPYQPTIFDEVAPQIMSARGVMTDEEATAAIGDWSETSIAASIKTLINAGWTWNAQERRMVPPLGSDPNESPLRAILRLQGGTQTPSPAMEQPAMSVPVEPGEVMQAPKKRGRKPNQAITNLAAQAAAINASEQTVAPSTNEFVQKMTGQQPSPQGVVPTPATEGKVIPGGSAMERDATKPERVGNTAAIPTAEESARWDAADAFNRSYVGGLSAEDLDLFGSKIGVKRQGVGDDAYRSKILGNTHPDDILDAIPDAPTQTAKVATPTETAAPSVDIAPIQASEENAGKIDNSKVHPSLISADGTRKQLYHGKAGEFEDKDLKINPNNMTTLSGIGPAWFTTSEAQANRFSVPRGNIMAPDLIDMKRPLVLEGDKASVEHETYLRKLSQINGSGSGFDLTSLANTDRYKWTPEQKAQWDEWYPQIREFLESQGVKKLKTGDKLGKFDWAEIYPLVAEFRKRLDAAMRDNAHPDADPFKKLQRLEKEARVTLRAIGDPRADKMPAGEAIRLALQIEGYDGIVLLNTMSDTKLDEVGEGYQPSDWVIPFTPQQVVSKAPQSPQTTASETQTPAPSRKGAGASGVVQSEPAEGSIPAVERESSITSIESTEKTDVAKDAMRFLEEDLTDAQRKVWTPEMFTAAQAFFDSGGKDFDSLKKAIKFPRVVQQAYLKADKDAAAEQSRREAADAALAREVERAAKEQVRAEAFELKRQELALKTLNSLIEKTRTNVVQGAVKPSDAQQAISILNKSGEIPNVLFTWIGTSKDFLADPANKARYPETWNAVSGNPNIEGMSENGQPIVFTDNVGVSDLDRKLANLQGTTPEVAAVRRVILHENIHKGMFFMSLKEKMKLFQFLRRLYSPEELDALAKSYEEYADWRTNQVSYFSIIEEAMTRDFDSMVEIPRDGVWAEFMQFLREIWQKITGKTSEPKLKDYKDVFRLIRNSLKNSEKVNADRLKNGGAVRMSMSEFISNVTPEQDAEYMAAVESGDVAKQQAMVDAAAKAAGYNVGPVYHGTNAKFTEFSKRFTRGQMGFHVGTESQANFFSEEPLKLFVRADNPLRLEDTGSWYGEEAKRIVGEALGKKLIRDSDSALAQEIQKAGYDSVVYKNTKEWDDQVEDDPQDSYIVFSPNQIKSADPITRDEQGNVIPLSRRFQSASNDIRFSKVGKGLSALFPRQSTIQDAYRSASQGQSSQFISLDDVFAKAKEANPRLTEEAFKADVMRLYDSGAIYLEGANSQQEAEAASLSIPGTSVGTAVRIAVPQDQYEPNKTSTVRPYASEGYGSQRMEGVSTGDNSPRAQAIRKAVSESNWNELSPTQRAKAMEDFGLEAISSRYSFDATLLPVRVTNERTDKNRPASILSSGPARTITIQFDTSGLADLLDGDAVTAFSEAYDMAQEQFSALSKQPKASKVEYDSPNEAAFNSGAEVARNTNYDERDKTVRSTIRAAYDLAPKDNGPSVPLGQLFDIAKQSMPDLTEAEFSQILQDLYEDSGALLQAGNANTGPSPGGLSEAEVTSFSGDLFRGENEGNGTDADKEPGGIHFTSDETYARQYGKIRKARVTLTKALDFRALGKEFTSKQLLDLLRRNGVDTKAQSQQWFSGKSVDDLLAGNRVIEAGEIHQEALDGIGHLIKKAGFDGYMFAELGDFQNPAVVVFSEQSLSSPESSRAAGGTAVRMMPVPEAMTNAEGRMTNALRNPAAGASNAAMASNTGAAQNAEPSPGGLSEAEWFSGSKVVTRTGKPLVVYHKTSADFTSFSFEEANKGSKPVEDGYHFGTQRAAAEVPREGGRVISVILNIKNPLRISDPGFFLPGPDFQEVLDERGKGYINGYADDLIAELERYGYDGIVYKNHSEGGGADSWMAFRPEQIRILAQKSQSRAESGSDMLGRGPTNLTTSKTGQGDSPQSAPEVNPESSRAAGGSFNVTTQDGERAGSAIVMPASSMTKEDVTVALRGMSAANPAPDKGINQELYDTVLTQLRNFISNGGRVPLPIQLDRSGEANMDNYTGKKAGLGGGLRQGSGVGRAGQADSGTPLFDGLPEGVQGVIPQAQRVESEVSRNREAIAGRGENREGKAGARPDMGMASGGYTFADYAQIASRIGARVQEVSNDIGGGLAVMADENGATTILINAAQLSERMVGISFGLDINGTLETIGNALVEELIHAADFAVQREAWIASGRREPFTQFAIDSDKSMLDEMRGVVASSNDPVRATRILFDAIQASRELYDSGVTPSSIDELFASPKGNISIVMSEFVRQMIQQNMHQTVSEASLFRRFIEHVMKVLQKIRDAIATAKAGEFGDALKNRIDETEMMLALAYQQTGAKASMVDPEGGASKKFVKDVQAINNGTLKAAFDGRQFFDKKPVDHIVKPNKSYEKIAIDYVDGLMVEGQSIEQIATSIMTPMFFDSIGINNDVKVRQALTADVLRRVTDLNGLSNTRLAAKRLGKLEDLLSAFWQGLGTESGGNQGQRAYIIGSPRYSWMFLKNTVKKEMKERRDNILNVQFGDENATSFTQNSYENADKANQQAAENVASDAESTQEGDVDAELLRDGEATLDAKQKTVWEKVKDAIRTKALIAKALEAMRARKAGNQAKASISEEARNAIFQMSEEELLALDAKMDKVISDGAKTFLGEEAAADTTEKKTVRKKREKMVEVAKKRADKGEPIEASEDVETSEDEVTRAEATAQAILKDLSERYSDPLIINEKKPNINEMRELYKERVKQGNGTSQMTEEAFVNKAIELGADEKTAGILWSAAELEIDAREAMRQDKIRQRNAAAGERADAQAHRIIFAKERLKRQSGLTDTDIDQNKDTIIKAFRDQVETPIALDAFIQRLIPLKVSRQVSERLFRAAEREKTDLEAMAAYDATQGPNALRRMLREINNMRRGEEVPLRTPIPWRQLLSQKAKTVEEYRQRIFDAISASEELKSATPEQKARLADLFSEAWESNRKRILDGMQERMIRAQEAEKKLSKKAAQALQENRMRIVEDINLGVFDNDELAKIIAEKYGIKSEFTDAEREKIESLTAILQDETLNRVKRNKAAYELLETLSAQTGIPIAKLLANFWVSSVLSGMNTVFSIGMSVFSGMGELTTALSRIFETAFRNPKQLSSEVAAAFKTLARVISAVPRQANRAWQYLVTGDQAFLDPSMSDALKNMDYASIGKNNQLSEQMAKSDNVLEKSMGLFMRTVSRLLTALDLFNSGLTKEGSLSIVFRQLDLGPEAIAMLEKRSDLKAYKDQVIQDYFNNTQPKTFREKALVDSYAMAEMMKALDEIGNVSENADQMAMQGAMTLDPSGIGGYGYRAVKSLMKTAETGADKLVERNLRKWDEAGSASDKTEALVKLGLSYLFQFAAYNAANLVGVRFARFAGNKFNQSLSFLPVLGALRLFEAEFDSDRVRGKEAFTDMIKRNQLMGVIFAAIGYQFLKDIADEPDDEERGWFINGGWSNLTPEKKQQKLAAGEKEYTIGLGDKVFNYGNWPGSGIIAAIGSLSDLIRFSPEQWSDKTVSNKLLSATTSGVFSAMEVPALSQFQELFGSSLSSKDPNEQKLTKFARVLGNYAGGFMPRILKDFDYLADPSLRKYETLWEKTASHIPIYRRYEGKEYYDILGQQIQRTIYPGSREFMTKPTDPAYKILGALNSRGIWLTPANAEHRMVGKGARRRKLTQEEADSYGLETGKGYKQMLLRYGQRALQMPTERARDFLLEKANDVRDKALKKVYRGYQPS